MNKVKVVAGENNAQMVPITCTDEYCCDGNARCPYVTGADSDDLPFCLAFGTELTVAGGHPYPYTGQVWPVRCDACRRAK